MKILIPMAGEGKRFADVGYRVSKPAIPTYDRRDMKKLPMVVCATLDLPGVKEDGSNVLYVDRSFHREDGTEDCIREHFPKAGFIQVDHLTEGQACTCLLAKPQIDNDEELLIAGCDNGMELDQEAFDKRRSECDMMVFTYRHNDCVLANPNAHGWCVLKDGGPEIASMSVKKAISDTPMEDHAVVATFWFKTGSLFVQAAENMIKANDRINNEFYVDQIVKYVLELGARAMVFEIDRYISWGTPEDYEKYQKTFEYWKGFYEKERKLIEA